MKRLKLLALLAVFALFAAACGGSDDDTTATPDEDTTGVDSTEGDGSDAVASTSAAGEGGDLLLLQWQAPSQVNVLLSGGTKDALASSIVNEPLARFAPDGSLVATLAAEIPTAANGGIPDDLTSVTWKLKEGIVWSDGTPFTANDAVFTYEYCIDEETGCASDAYTNVVSVVADDDLTLTITFDAPTPFPFVAFVGYLAPIIQAAQFADCVGAAAESCSDENLNPIGTGPYIVTEMRPEDTVVYTFNPLFRGNADGQPSFGTVEIKGGGDAEAAARSVLEIGEADYAWNLQVDPTILGPMEDAGNGRVLTAFASNVEHINLNQTNNRADGDLASDWADGANPNPFFFENPEFARALSLAINRDDLVTVGYGPTGIPTCNMWNKTGEQSTTNNWCLTQDVDEANAILDGLGYVDTDNDGIRELPDGTPLEFSFATSTNAVRQSNQDLIQVDWQEIGVATNMINESASLFFDGTNGDVSIWRFPTDIEMFTNGPTNTDAQTYMSGFQTTEIPTLAGAWGGNNISRIASDEYDKIWTELSTTGFDDPNRLALILQLDDYVSGQSGAIIPLILRASVSAFSNEMQNIGDLNGWDSEYWNIHEWTRTG